MTSLTGTPAALTAYLRRATWGLPRARQQELWDELEEHVLTSVDHLCALGASPEQALSQALRELGPPARVSAGMTQVYLMPKVILAATASALALSAALYALAGGNEGSVTLPVLTQRPAKPTCVRGTVPRNVNVVSRQGNVTCFTFNDLRPYQGAFLNLSAVRDALEAQGGRADFVNGRSLDFRLPGGRNSRLTPFFTANGQGYISADRLVTVVVGGPTRVTLNNYAAPLVRLGSVQLRFGNSGSQTVGRAFYSGLAPTLVGQLLPPAPPNGSRTLTVSYNLTGGSLHHVQTALPAGEVVLLVNRESQGNNYETDTAEVQPDGSARLRSSKGKLRFTSSMDQLSPYPSGGRTPALLVRVTNVPLNNLKSGIFLPAQPTSDAPR